MSLRRGAEAGRRPGPTAAAAEGDGVAESEFASVGEYIASFPADVQPVLEDVRRAILGAVPGAGEAISYGIAAITLDGTPLLYFAGWKRHVSLYPVPAGDLGDEAGGDGLAERELQRALGRAVGLDPALEVRVAGRHRIQADVPLPAREVHQRRAVQRDRRDAVADRLPGPGHGAADRAADILQDRPDVSRERGDVIAHRRELALRHAHPLRSGRPPCRPGRRHKQATAQAGAGSALTSAELPFRAGNRCVWKGGAWRAYLYGVAIQDTVPPALRASDFDREQAIELLRHGSVEGRISHETFLHRMDAAMRAQGVA